MRVGPNYLLSSRAAADPSGRELEVLQLVADGLANDEIAARLFISRNTVVTHLKRVYAKLGISGWSARTHACVIGLRRGLIV